MRASAENLTRALALSAGLLPLCAAAGDAPARQERICERDPTRPSCEVMGTGRTGPKAFTPPPVAPSPLSANAPAPQAANPPCERDPTRPSCEAMGRGRTIGAPYSANYYYDRERASKNVARGAVAGAVGGTVLGVASCAPFLWGPPLYTLCAASGFVLGILGGGMAGLVADGVANSKAPDPASFDEALRKAALEREHSAVAVAMGNGQWAWGISGGASTPELARFRALERCREQLAQKRFDGACAIYSINGQPADLIPQ